MQPQKSLETKPWHLPFFPVFALGNGRAKNRPDLSFPPAIGLEIEDGLDWDWSDLRVLIEPLADGMFMVSALHSSGAGGLQLRGEEGQVLKDDFWRPDQVLVAGGKTSYGINNRVNVFLRDSGKVLLVEYHKQVAHVVGDMPKDIWDDQVAPRHAGTLNVLFGDGRVKAVQPHAIDPTVTRIHDELWRPHRDPKLGP